ncbi:hypothetical protein [Roseovarius pelagicus]|uniref:Uncharacterized protein n=1 Tax=Roseovarius pelagicus TaxID=2980108 RepID=A0ABY6DGE2_9RHOB|nr:hypothetical protein [Roseovarius pelagicus]UXX84013.1 hypothetical protein N7U68_04990 [Roseovarius pelagicus]
MFRRKNAKVPPHRYPRDAIGTCQIAPEEPLNAIRPMPAFLGATERIRRSGTVGANRADTEQRRVIMSMTPSKRSEYSNVSTAKSQPVSPVRQYTPAEPSPGSARSFFCGPLYGTPVNL